MDVNSKVYKRRWLILVIFCLASALNTAHWLQYAIITNIIIKYYEVSSYYVNWTTMIYSVMYITLIFPASWLMATKGLRLTMFIALSLMVAGSWLKLLSTERYMFIVAFISQSLMAAAQTFIFSVPPRLAALWFPTEYVSIVCAIGVAGNQFGAALSFLLPPMVIKNSDNMLEIRSQLMALHIGMAIPTTLLFLAAIYFFEKAPPLPPGIAQLIANARNVGLTYIRSLRELAVNKDYLLLIVAYSMNISVFYTFSTLLNQMLLKHYPKGEEDAGNIGVILIIGGMAGTIILGYTLNRTHWFKGISSCSYAMALTGIISFTFSLYYEYLLLVYISSSFMGVFMAAYITVAFEFAAELTYPLTESTATSVMSCFGEVTSLTSVTVAGHVVEGYGDLATNLIFISAMLVGFLASILINGKRLLRIAAAEGR